MKIKIHSPWGTFRSGKDNPNRTFYKQTLEQLLFYQKAGNNSDHIKRDIEGYEKLLSYDSEEICDKFREVKMGAREAGRPFKDNLAVIEKMKELYYI